MAELIGYCGKVMVVRYKLGSQSTLDRERGFDDAIRSYRHIRIVETSRLTGEPRLIEKSTKVSAAQCCNDIQGVFCSLEFSTAGMLRELTNNKLIRNVALVGFDTNDTIAEGLEDGRIQALLLQDPVHMGYCAVKAMVDYLCSTRANGVPPSFETAPALDTFMKWRVLWRKNRQKWTTAQNGTRWDSNGIP